MMKFDAANPNLRNILVKAETTGECLAITTFDRLHGHRGRFLICRESLEAWMEDPRGRSFYDTDCGHFLQLRQDGDYYVVAIAWLSEYGDSDLRGFQQRFTLPMDPLFNLLMCGGAAIRWLSTGRRGTTTIDSSHVEAVIRKLCADRHKRRAFSKAMRDFYQWGDEIVTLYPDGGSSFYFTTKSGYPQNGGLILHESVVQTRHGKLPKLYYSVHT